MTADAPRSQGMAAPCLYASKMLQKSSEIRILFLIALTMMAASVANSCSLTSTPPAENPWDENLNWVAAHYLEDRLFDPSFGGQVFCATEMLHLDKQGTAIKAYVWALCIEYYEGDQTLHMGTAVSEPLLIYMIELQGRTRASGFAEPRDGPHFSEDINHMFPNEAVERMCLEDLHCKNARVQQLEAVIVDLVTQTYNQPIATQPRE